MRLRICRQPTGVLDGISLDSFRAGMEYDLGAQLASVFLAEGWAEPVDGLDGKAPPPDGMSALILVVDDDTDLRQLTASVLACNGYKVVEAQDGREALGRLAQHTPDLVVLDLNMPVMNGWEFCAAQQRLEGGRLASVPVLLLTGTHDAGNHVARLKAVGLLEKPFDPDRLLGAIQAALRR